MKSFIDEQGILGIIHNTKFSPVSFREIINKAFSLKGLDIREAAMLLSCTRDEYLSELFSAAGKIKELIYGRRLVFFAPLYISNFCTNNCLYCGFRNKNKTLKRKLIDTDEIKQDVEFLISEGHKRLLVVAGQDNNINADYLADIIKTIYSINKSKGEIRRVNINVAPLEYSGFKKIKKAGIGTYQIFQETYHGGTYKFMHPSGPKSDFDARLYAIDVAQAAGIDDVGIGVLFGLYDYRFETLALLKHCSYLDDKFGVGPHTISVPRIEPASGSSISNNPPYKLSDIDFKKVIAVLRLAVPYAGLILSTREKPALRNELFNLGISQISAGSRTNPGGYSSDTEGQFSLGDYRTLKEVVCDVTDRGFIASFCTACYRKGRTGGDFMELAKPGNIQEFCLSNALLTFKEYILDYKAMPITDVEGFIRKQVATIKDCRIREATVSRLKKIGKGERDIYF
ncbi:MAG TPA: [FeFe] hydrogenase H-cluster radical SAM maturase HydG [Candidatus Omnitrophica bacterium]|nr:[FeFe] hydrogenase H-cluster radical SAM maturase HydG [Candidatus Omnitrophota bacterium]